MDRSSSLSSLVSVSTSSSSRSLLLPVNIQKPSAIGTASLPLSSPSNKQQSQKRPSQLNSPDASSQRSPTKGFSPHPDNTYPKSRLNAPAMTLSTTRAHGNMMGVPEDNAVPQHVQQQNWPESAQQVIGRRAQPSGLIAPLDSAQSRRPLLPEDRSNSAWSMTSSPPIVISSSRCAGCGGFAEMCFSCFTLFKQQDGARYKIQLVQSVDVLFARATTRAFRRMAAVVLQWVFQAWRAAARRSIRKGQVAATMFRKQRLRRLWKTWQVFLYERRIVGAMLYAEAQQRETHEKAREVAKLHGDEFERESVARVNEALWQDAVKKLETQLAALATSMHAKDRELCEIRKELHGKDALIKVLKTQVVDPQELERLRVESYEYKKASFQLVGALTQTLETQVEILSTSEGRQNLSEVFTHDILQSIDKPENSALYNSLVGIETFAAAPTDATANAINNITLAYEAPVHRAEEILTQWVNSLIARQPPKWLAAPRMSNFHSSLSDGKVYAVVTKLLHAAMCRTRLRRPPGATAIRLEGTSVLRGNGEDLTDIGMERYLDHMHRETSGEKRVELMVNTLGQAMWLPLGLLDANDICAGHAELNFAALTYFFVTSSPCLAPDYYSTCAELAQQLDIIKRSWCELQSEKVASESSVAGLATGDETSLSMRIRSALSQTLEVKRRIDAEDNKSREGHALWIKAEHIVMRKCFLLYARLARGKMGVETELK